MSSDFQLRKDDTVILLFNDNSKLTYKFSKNRTGQKYMYSNSELLTKESIIIFATKKLKKIKITNANRNLFDVYHLQRSFFNSQYHNEISGQYLVWLMTKKFIEIHKDNNIQLPSS